MKVSVIEKGEISRTLQIEVPSETVSKEYERMYVKVARRAPMCPASARARCPAPSWSPRSKGSVLNQMLDDLLPK